MAYDTELADIMAAHLAHMQGISEKKMFGGICFMLDGNMLCGIHKKGAMFRVGKENMAAALAIEGAGPMAFTGRPMGGMVDVDAEALADDLRRDRLMALALQFAGHLPPK